MKAARKWIINILILVISIGLTLYFVLRGEDLNKTIELIKAADLRWCILGFIAVIAFIMSESVIIWYLMQSLPEKARLSRCFIYSFAGFFVSAITPSASGGQPVQMFFMKKDNLSLHTTVPVLTVVTILYKGVLIVISSAVLLFRPSTIIGYIDPVIFWCYLGLFLNIVCVAALIICIYKPEWIKKIAAGTAKFMQNKLHIKKQTNLVEKVSVWCDQYADVAGAFTQNKKSILVAFLLTAIQRIILFSITYFCCIAFGLTRVNPVVIIVLQGIVASAADMMPLPGGTGVNEALFLNIFAPIVGSELNVPIMLLSRGLNYYSQIIIGGIVTMIAFITYNFKKKKESCVEL